MSAEQEYHCPKCHYEWESICDFNGCPQCGDGRIWLDGEEHSLTRRQEWNDGGIWMEAAVHQGGNGLWTAWVIKTERGRPRKRGGGFCAGKTLDFKMPPQMATRQLAKEWCDSEWRRMSANLSPLRIAA